MSGRSGARRGRVRVHGGMGRGGMSSGRGKLTFVDDNPFSALDSDKNGGSVSRSGLMDNRKSRQDKKRQRISTGTSDELYNDDDDYNDSDTEEMDDDDDNEQNDDFMQLSMDQKLAATFTKISRTDVRVDRLYKEKLGRRVQRVESVLSAHEQRIKLLEYRSIDIEARSRRRNLLFKRIREYGQVENCFDLVRDFIADNLNIQDNMYLERAHRLGSLKQNQSKPRPIIVAFRDYYDTEMILQAAPDLKKKQTNYSVVGTIRKKSQRHAINCGPIIKRLVKIPRPKCLSDILPGLLLMELQLTISSLTGFKYLTVDAFKPVVTIIIGIPLHTTLLLICRYRVNRVNSYLVVLVMSHYQSRPI